MTDQPKALPYSESEIEGKRQSVVQWYSAGEFSVPREVSESRRWLATLEAEREKTDTQRFRADVEANAGKELRSKLDAERLARQSAEQRAEDLANAASDLNDDVKRIPIDFSIATLLRRWRAAEARATEAERHQRILGNEMAVAVLQRDEWCNRAEGLAAQVQTLREALRPYVEADGRARVSVTIDVHDAGVGALAATEPIESEKAKPEGAVGLSAGPEPSVTHRESNRVLREALAKAVPLIEDHYRDFDFGAWRKSWGDGVKVHPAELVLEVARRALAGSPAERSPHD